MKEIKLTIEENAQEIDGELGELILPDVGITATVDQTPGAPSVTVEKSGSAAAPSFHFYFSGLKGEAGPAGADGRDGAPGAAGERGPRGEDGEPGAKGDKGDPGVPGLTPEITIRATVDQVVGSPSVTVTQSGTAEAPVFVFAFSGLKGEAGADGASPEEMTYAEAMEVLNGGA